MLQIGKLTRTKRKTRVSGVTRTHTIITGQVSMMIEPCWRIEKSRSIQFGSAFKEKTFKQHSQSLVGVRIASVEVVGRVPELRVNFDDRRALATFSDNAAQPCWCVLVKDVRLVPMHDVWQGVDVTPVFCVFAGRPAVD